MNNQKPVFFAGESSPSSALFDYCQLCWKTYVRDYFSLLLLGIKNVDGF